MSLEIEKRFKNFDYNKIKKQLKELEIKKERGVLFKLASYRSLREGYTGRIRDEGTKITFTIKQKKGGDRLYDTEYEVVVDNYEMMDRMIQLLGLEKLYDLHKYREIYKTSNGKSEIIFDHFPGLPPYMEVESKTEKELKSVMKKLGLNDEANFTAKDLYFEQYGVTKDRKDTSLTYQNANEMLDKFITKNKDKFNDILKHQNKFLNKKVKTIYSV